MVRRATLDRAEQVTAADEALPEVQPAPGDSRESGGQRQGRQRQGRQHRGAGGRWLIWILRGLAWAVLLLIGYRGVAAIVTGPQRPAFRPVSPVAAAASRFPVTLAEAYALDFGSAYLSFSPATAAERARQLAAFLPPGKDPQLGWNGAGSQSLQSEQVAAIRISGAHQAIVTLLAQVNGHLVELGVPVYSSGAGLVISGEPALLPAPLPASPPQPPGTASDPVTAAALSSQLPAFFHAYATGDAVTLSRFLAHGTAMYGLGGAVTFGSISAISVPAGGAVRNITVTVLWHAAGTRTAGRAAGVAAARADLEMTYEMTVIQQGGSWYVQSISASPGPPGQP